MSAWHITFSSDGRRPLFPTETERRTALRCLGRVAGKQLALFSLVDEHVHLIGLGSRALAGRLCQRLALALRSLCAAPLDPARLRPVQGRSHALNLLRYLLEQPLHHGLPVHPATWGGSCFADLIGARLLDGLDLRVVELIPRFRLREAFELVRLPPEPLVPWDDGRVGRAGVGRLIEAAGAALAVGPALRGVERVVVRARRAICQLALQAHLSPGDLRRGLELSQQAVHRLGHSPPEPRLLQAIRLQLALQEAALQAPPDRTSREDRHGPAADRGAGWPEDRVRSGEATGSGKPPGTGVVTPHRGESW